MSNKKDRISIQEFSKLRIKVICILFVLAVFNFRESLPVFAAAGVYTATANPYYRHPVTGIVEDAGNNEGIGQGMTESVLHPVALIEETEEGSIYVTVRFFLAEYISDVKFWTQKREDTDWISISHTIMQENAGEEYCTDYRFQIPAKDAVVKSSFFVSPMGRNVIFYMDFTDLKEGSSDFIVSAGADSAHGAEITESAGELLASAQGLVLSDVTLLTSGQDTEEGNDAGSVQVAGTEFTGTKDTGTKDTETKVIGTVAAGIEITAAESRGTEIKGTETAIPSLPWKLVWQCILIITLPGFLVGAGLLALLRILGRKEEENER